MKKLLLILLLFTILLSISSSTFAAFPVTDPVPESTIEIVEPIIYNDSPWPNIVSLSCAVLAMLFPIELAIFPFVAAIVFGSIGFRKRLKGMGIAGFILGILGAIGVIILTEGFEDGLDG